MTHWPFLVYGLLSALAAVALFYFSDGGMEDGALGCLGILGTLATGLTALVCFSGFALVTLEHKECSDHGRRLNVTTSYETWTGCYVEVDGRSIPYDRWIDVSKEDTP